MMSQKNLLKNLRVATQIGLLASLVGLAGCASSMSKQDCEAKDFYKMGLNDGQDGKSASNFQNSQAQCQKQGVNVTDEKYNYGRQVGLASYCSESRAKDDARSGKTDSTCMKEKVPPYMTSYDAALSRLKKQHEQDLKDVESNQAKLQKREDQLKGQVNKIDDQQKQLPSELSFESSVGFLGGLFLRHFL